MRWLRWLWRHRSPPPPPAAVIPSDVTETARLAVIKEEAIQRLEQQYGLWDRVKQEAELARRLRARNEFGDAILKAWRSKIVP